MRTAAIIPARSGGEELSRVLAALPDGHLQKVVVVGGPGTGIAETARQHGATPVEESRRGFGRACLAGMAHLAADPPEVVVFLRGDGSDDAEELPAVLSPLLIPGVDFVMGSRTRGQPDPGALPALVRFGHWIATRLILFLFLYGYRFTDLGPFRAARWRVLPLLGMSDPDYGWLVEMQVNAARARVPSAEVAVSTRRIRGRGAAAGHFFGSILGGLKVLLTVLQPADPAGRTNDRAGTARQAE